MKKIFLSILTSFILFIGSVLPAYAASVSWDGGGDGSSWSDGANWSGDTVPTIADDVTIDQNGISVNLGAATTINSLTLGNAGGTNIVTFNFAYDAISNGQLTIQNNFTQYSGTTLTHSKGTTVVVGTVKIYVQGDWLLSSGATVNVDSKGYRYGSGPGTGSSGGAYKGSGGGGYGGSGGTGSGDSGSATGGVIYESVDNPVQVGSGGGVAFTTTTSADGAGAIVVNVEGLTTISGSISANGENGSQSGTGDAGGGGSGGAVNLTSGSFTGSGSITAKGGNGGVASRANGGGGGGGRVVLNYTTSNSYSGSIIASGGTASGNSKVGGAGTILLRQSGSNGDLFIDNGTITSDYTHSATYLTTDSSFDSVTIRNYAIFQSKTTVDISGLLLLDSKGVIESTPTGILSYGSFNQVNDSTTIVDNGGAFTYLSGGGDLVVPSTSILVANISRSYSSVIVNGTLTSSNNGTSETYKIDHTVSGNYTINAGGSIDLEGKGFQPAAGTGKGENGAAFIGGGGGGYGGEGGAGTGNYGSVAGGISYGSQYNPNNIGSGGGNGYSSHTGRGGGAVTLDIGGTLSVEGSINVNGISGTYTGSGDADGGGAGGTINIITNNLEGSGAISANGGDGGNTSGAHGGGGGGGRIVIYYSNNNLYSGEITATGGIGSLTAGDGGEGTIVKKAIGGELVSSPFDTADPATLIYGLSWTESLAAGTDIKLQLRTAPDNSGSPGAWTDWLGPTSASDYYTDPAGTSESINASHSDASSDQWIQYKIIFSANSGDQFIPTISDVTLTYIINTAPTVSITNTTNLSSTGTISTSFTVSDPEESTTTNYLAADIGATIGSDLITGDTNDLLISDASNFPNSGTILIDDEMLSYTGKSGNSLTGISRGANSTTDTTHLSSSSVWFVASTAALSGDYGSQSLLGVKNIVWTPSTDLTNLETTTAQLKVIAIDGNLANQINSDSVNSVTLDTKPPTSADIFINKYSGKLIPQASDSNSIFYKASNSSDLTADGVNSNSGEWVVYSTPVDWNFSGDPSTVYIAYKDEYGNTTNTLSTVSPTRLSSLIIQDASNPDTSEWRLFVSWVTATAPANGFNYYQIYRSTDGVNYTDYAQINNISENYLIDTNLDSNTTYYYRTTIVDSHGNESDANYPIQTSGSSSRSGIGLTPDGSGGGDFTGPVISNISISNLTTTSITINWTTDELSDSTIGYSTDTNYAFEVGSITMTTDHTLTLNNLSPNTKFYYRTISSDSLNNKSTTEDSSTYYFTTLADTDGPTISSINSVTGETSAGITWSTSEPANSLVEYSLDTSYSDSTSSASLVQGHALTIPNLTNNTTYHYRVTSADSSGNTSVSPAYTFTTESIAEVDTTGPSISNITVSDVTATSAKVNWSTGEDADGKVEYGESTSYERGISEGNHEYTTSKSATLIGLSPETTYHYKITAVDQAGNTNSSSDATFLTSTQSTVSNLSDIEVSSGVSAPSITSESPAVTDINSDSVTVSWDTNKKSTSEIYYRIKNSSDPLSNAGNISLTSSHAVILKNLVPATTYEYQVKSVDVNGNYITSGRYEFTTTLPGVASVRVTSKSENGATVEWVTATPTSTVIEYTNGETREKRLYSNSSLVTSHIANLTGLSPSTAYLFEVVISDEVGNLARSDQYSFVTDIDTEGPVISAVNNRSTIIAGQNKVQTVITWVTNEPTTSQVSYSLGSGVGNYDQSTVENTDYVNNHIMVIANLKPGSVYRYRVNSRDRAGNLVESDPFVLLTPQKEVSALDLIIQNLQGAFGWLNNIGG